MATNWSRSAAPGTGTNPSGDTYTITLVPTAGELVIVFLSSTKATTAYTGATAGDTGSGGWTQIAFDSSGGTAGVAFWKMANSVDNNGGSGITITLTGTGGSGGVAQFAISAERYATSVGTVTGVDLTGHANTTGTSLNVSPSIGSSESSNTDELAWAMVATNLNQGGAGTWDFTGTSATTAMTASLANILLLSEYLGGVQASATAGTNVWATAWNTLRFAVAIGATFYYTPTTSIAMVI